MPRYLAVKTTKLVFKRYPIISRNEQVPERGDPIEAEKVNSG